MSVFKKTLFASFTIAIFGNGVAGSLLHPDDIEIMESICASGYQKECIVLEANKSNNLNILKKYEKLNSHDPEVQATKYYLFALYADKFAEEKKTDLAEKYYRMAIVEASTDYQKQRSSDKLIRFYLYMNKMELAYDLSMKLKEMYPEYQLYEEIKAYSLKREKYLLSPIIAD